MRRLPRSPLARRWEGEALAAVLMDRLDAIAATVEAADSNPARRA